MAFEGLSERLEAAFKRLKSKGSLTESDVKDAMREVRLALLEADVNYKVAKDFTKTVTERAVGEKVMEKLKSADEVAYVRFASVYRQFKDINTFMSELNKLLNEK